jgi:hypothetical protein
MKLDIPEVKVTVSDPSIPMEEFGIGNLGVIMETLRSKIYSNPRRIVLQEIACNARDANREVGKGNTPIRIKLPTKHEPELHITDEGPGIDPIRMKEIYLLLAIPQNVIAPNRRAALVWVPKPPSPTAIPLALRR